MGPTFEETKPTVTVDNDFFNRRDLLKVVREAFAGYGEYLSTTQSTTLSIFMFISEKGQQLMRDFFCNDSEALRLLDEVGGS